jgi:predicted nuclease of predicted toxin-antitoxin system
VSPTAPLRFKIDSNLPAEAAEVLRRAGHQADTAADEGLAGADDARLAAACVGDVRAIVSADTDFADIRAHPPSDHLGIVVLRLRRQSKPRILAAIERLLPALGREPLVGALWIVDETSVRIRR